VRRDFSEPLYGIWKTINGDKTLLFYQAIDIQKIEMVRIFLNQVTDVEMRESYGRRAFHRVVMTEDADDFSLFSIVTLSLMRRL
jgi:hypothetical protein